MAADIFAKIGDIKGESLDAKHKDEVEVLSWSWGVTQTGSRRCQLKRRHVCLWHKADIEFDAEHVRFRGQSGHL